MAEAVLELRNNRLVWYSECPDHKLKSGKGKRTSTYRGQQKALDGSYWIVFRCAEKGGHLFNARMPKDAPRNAEEIATLLRRMQMAKVNSNPDSTRRAIA